MPEAIDIIRAEHRNITQALAALETATRDLSGGDGKPDLELLFTVLYYMRLFPARLHHPKEERYLFAALARRSPEAKEVIDRLSEEHQGGEDALDTVERALKFYDRHRPDGRAALERVVGDYLELERAHMKREEEVLLPLAEKALSAADWSEVDNAFANNAGSLFNDDLAVGFQSLRLRIENMLHASRRAA